MMGKYKLIENFQTKAFSNRKYIENLSNTKNKATIVELNISISNLKTLTFKTILFSFTFQKSLRFDKDSQFFWLNTVSIMIFSVFAHILFFNFKRSRSAFVSNQIINKITNSKESRFEKIVSFAFEEAFSVNTIANVN